MGKVGHKRYWLPLVGLFLAFAGYEWFINANWDNLYWPQSAKDRIENEAAIVRRTKGRARWCYASTHSANLIGRDWDLKDEWERCLAKIEPVSDFIETYPGEYIKRFYRAQTERYICEATLSTVRDNDRIVGADCYYGLFERDTAPPVGATDDPFG